MKYLRSEDGWAYILFEDFSEIHQGPTTVSKFNKCEFWLKSVVFIGHIVYEKNIVVDPKNTNVVKSCATPIYPSYIVDILGFRHLL